MVKMSSISSRALFSGLIVAGLLYFPLPAVSQNAPQLNYLIISSAVLLLVFFIGAIASTMGRHHPAD